MNRIGKRASLALGSLALIAALAPAPQAPVEVGEVKALAEARVKVGRKILDYYKELLLAPPAGKDGPTIIEKADQIQNWSRLVADARLDTADRREERIAILSEEVTRARDFEKELKALVPGEPSGPLRFMADKAEFFRLEIETRLAKEKAGR
jgi:hypothetical protein